MIEQAVYTGTGDILATIDGMDMTVPNTLANRHRQMIADWEAEGNAIAPFEPLPPSVEDFQAAIQAHVDAAAVSRRYNDGNALAGYVASTNAAWAAEAEAFVAWRDAVWLYAYSELDMVMTGQRPQPTVDAFIAELPAIAWPSE